MLNIQSGLYLCPQHWLNNTLEIALVGVGATGCAIATLLFKLNHIRSELTHGDYGINLYLFDGKAVTETGKNRTGFLSTEVGMNKSVVMANKLNNALGKQFAVGTGRDFCKKDAKHNFDVVITASDSASSRNMIARSHTEHPSRLAKLWLDVGVGEHYGNVVLGEFGHGKHRLPNVTDLFPAIQLEEEDKKTNRASCDVMDAITRQSFCVNEIGASMGIAILSKLMLQGSIATQGAMYDSATCGSSSIHINKTLNYFN